MILYSRLWWCHCTSPFLRRCSLTDTSSSPGLSWPSWLGLNRRVSGASFSCASFSCASFSGASDQWCRRKCQNISIEPNSPCSDGVADLDNEPVDLPPVPAELQWSIAHDHWSRLANTHQRLHQSWHIHPGQQLQIELNLRCTWRKPRSLHAPSTHPPLRVWDGLEYLAGAFQTLN